ncbi:MAG TPA: ABC transporter permease [Vicinamibacterales bacterium]|nr:ABC transporter permease [Vicinamibacterales bacterium]
MLRLIYVSTQIAARALKRHPLRTGLTMLGVIIGVAAVIAMVALGSGARGSVETSLKSAGTNIIQVSAGNYTRGGESMNIASGLGSATTLTLEDADAIRGITGVQHVSAGVRNRGWVKAAHRQFFTQLRGAYPQLADIHGWEWLGGRFDAAADRAVMGRAAARELFGEGFEPVGERITIGDRAFTVSGYFRTNDPDMDETVFVLLPAAQAMWNVRHLHTITVSIEQAGDASRIAADITQLLRERHARGRRAATTTGLGGNQLPGVAAAAVDDFTVKTQAAANVTKGLYTSVAAFALANMPKLDEVTLQEMSSTLSRAGSTMTALLASIAAISLIVGGIGIMNIMLVSVTERTKEIGLRLAVGARRRDVLVQFLVEAMVMSLAGGIVGAGLGIVTARTLTAVLDWPTEVSVMTVLSAFAIAALVGIVFGYYPARRASRLDPIDSLRYE